MNKIKILSINISQEKGTIKKPVKTAFIEKNGIKGDAHYGISNREVSILDISSIKKYESILNRKINYGEFAENLTTSGIDYKNVNPLDIFKNENLTLQVTQIGKECHANGCAIFKEVGKCVMPNEGIFARVLKSGKININDELIYEARVIKFAVITLSDRAFNNEYEDLSGKIIIEKISNFFSSINYKTSFEYYLLPDNEILLEAKINKLIKNHADIIITTGGTGIGERDITPNVISKLITKEIPGIMDYVRLKYGNENLNALTSRSIAGIKEKSIIFSLPGSKKAVTEYMDEIVKHLLHLIYMINNINIH